MTPSALRTLAALAALVVAPNARADLITWGTPAECLGPSDVSVQGNPMGAYHFDGGAGASPTVNGVTFQSLTPLGWTPGSTGMLGTSTTGFVDYNVVLDSAAATVALPTTSPSEWAAIRLDTLAPLTLGSVYEVQVWYSDQRVGSAAAHPAHERVVRFRSAAGSAVVVNSLVTNLGALSVGPRSSGLDADPNDLSGGTDTVFGSHIVGTFRRTSSLPLWLLVQGTQADPSAGFAPELNALQIRDLGFAGARSLCQGDGTADAGAGPVQCPCANPSGVGGNQGCAHFAGLGARLGTTGSNFVVNDDLQFTVAGAIQNQPSMLVQGATRIALPFKDGILCAGNPTLRLEVVFLNGSGTGTTFGSMVTLGGVQAGDTRYYQLWYRTPGPTGACGSGSNFTQALEITWE